MRSDRALLLAAVVALGACPHDFSRERPDAGDDLSAEGLPDCPAGLSRCDGDCVDTSSSAEHCGGCGQACDDGLDCTDDVCAAGSCDNLLKTGWCRIGGACYADGQYQQAAHQCLRCDTSLNIHGWSAAPNPGCVTTLAGSGLDGVLDGPALEASFHEPTDVAVGDSGVVYVADAGKHVIRAISGGTVTTYAGSPGKQGDAGGERTSAFFNRPAGLAIDPAGTIFVADEGAHRIRRIDGDMVSTVAGSSSARGHQDGAVDTARFDGPKDVAIGPAGEIYVADAGNNCVRKIAGGQVTTIAGIPSDKLLLHDPSGVAYSGAVYVADTNNHRIKRLAGSGLEDFAGSGQSGFLDEHGLDASLFHPTRLAVDLAGVIIFADRSNHAIRKIENGDVITVTLMLVMGAIPGYTDGPASEAAFNDPRGVDVDAARIYVADTGNRRIRVIHR